MQGTPTTTAYFNDTGGKGFADTSDELKELDNAEAGDYITVVYETPSNAGSWHRAGGEVIRTRDFAGRLDDLWFKIEDTDRDETGDMAHLHVNPETGDYSFTDNVDSMEQHGVKKVAYTPEN